MTIQIVDTLYLEECWVCLVKRGTKNFEEHHVVPRSYGGERGPTVSLCCDCHTTAHKAADALYAKGNPVVPLANPMARERALYLAQVICNARSAIENINSENKRYVYSGFFDGKTHARLVRLAAYLKMPQQKVIKYAINSLYERLLK